MPWILGEPTVQQYFDANGDPLVNGDIEFFETGTSTPAAVASDSAGSSTATRYALNSIGAPRTTGGTAIALFFDSATTYKIVRKDASGTPIAPTIDPYNVTQGAQFVIDAIDTGASDSLYDYVGSTDGQQAIVAGYYTPGDGGGGDFYWNATSTDADDNGLTTVLPTGHVGAGRWKRIFSGAVNPRWGGARGNGLTDDTAAFVAVRDAGDQAIHVPAGNYRLTGLTLSVADQVWSMDAGAVLELADQANAVLLTISGTGVVVSGGKIDGRRAEQTSNLDAVVLSGARARLEDCQVTGSGASGVNMSGTDSVCLRVTANDCGIGTTSSGEAGITAITGDRMKILHCQTFFNARNGIYYRDCAEMEIAHCVTRLNGVIVIAAGSGIRSGGAGTPNCRVHHNMVVSNAEAGIYIINGSDDSVILANVCENNNTGANPGGHGIEINSSPGTVAIANTCIGNNNGISCNGDKAYLLANNCNSNSSNGIKVFDTSGIVVRDNICDSNTLAGIDANGSAAVTGAEFTNNSTSSNTTSGIAISSDFTDALVLDNTGSGNGVALLSNSGVRTATKTVNNADPAFLVARDFEPMSGTPTFSGLQSGAVGAPVWLMDATAVEVVEGVVLVPPSAASVDLELWWCNAGAGAGDVVWTGSIESLESGDNVTVTGASSNATSTAGAQYIVVTESLVTGFAVTSQVLKVRIVRQATDAGDTLANDAGLIGVKISKA